MNSPFVAWHFYWYKRHLAILATMYTASPSDKVEHHLEQFTKHNRWMVRNAIDVLEAYQAELYQKAFPKA